MFPVDGTVWQCPLRFVHGCLLLWGLLREPLVFLLDSVGTFEASSLFFSCKRIQVILTLLACELDETRFGMYKGAMTNIYCVSPRQIRYRPTVW